MPFLGSLSPELVWGLFTRGLGLVFLISFAVAHAADRAERGP